MSSGILSTAGLLSNSTIVYIVYLPHETLVYPPKIYFPTLTIVTVGPLPSQREWNVRAAQPSTDARQQRIQRELTLLITSESHLFNGVRFFLLFPIITESCKPRKIVNFLNLTKKNYGRAKLLKTLHQLNWLFFEQLVTLQFTRQDNTYCCFCIFLNCNRLFYSHSLWILALLLINWQHGVKMTSNNVIITSCFWKKNSFLEMIILRVKFSCGSFMSGFEVLKKGPLKQLSGRRKQK